MHLAFESLLISSAAPRRESSSSPTIAQIAQRIRAAKAGAEVVTYDDPQARGKGSALAFGFEYAASQGMDAVLVVDADSTVSRNLIGLVREALANGAEAVQCRYEMESSSKRPATQLTALGFRGFNVVRPIGRSRLGLSAGIVGNGFAIRQAVLTENPCNSLSVVEDLEYHIRLVLCGKKVQFLHDARVSVRNAALETGRRHSAFAMGRRTSQCRRDLARTSLSRQLMRGRLRIVEPLLDLMSLPIGYVRFSAAACPVFAVRMAARLRFDRRDRRWDVTCWLLHGRETILPAIFAFWLAHLVTYFGSSACCPASFAVPGQARHGFEQNVSRRYKSLH